MQQSIIDLINGLCELPPKNEKDGPKTLSEDGSKEQKSILPKEYEWAALIEGIYFDEIVKRMSVFSTSQYSQPIVDVHFVGY